MKNPIFLIVSGVLVFLIGLWAGSWLVSKFPWSSNYNFAAFSTGFIICAGGFVLIGVGINKLMDNYL